MKRPFNAFIAVLALSFVALFAPTAAAAAVMVDEPIVSASTHGENGAVYLDWYTTADVDTVEVTATDAAGAVSTRTAPASQASMTFIGQRPGSWSASVVAIAGGARSSAVPVWISVTGDSGASQPSAPAPIAPAPTAAAPTPAATAAAAAQLSFSLVPGPDGTIVGAGVRVTGASLAPSTPFNVRLSIAETKLVEGTTDDSGAVDAQFPLPADLAPGQHTLVFTGTDLAGGTATGEYTITIEAAADEAVVAPVAPAPTDEGGLAEILALQGDAAVPYLVGGAVAATAATGAVAGAAASVSIRIRRLKLTRLLDLEYPGTGSGGGKGVLGGILDLVAKVRGAG
ncbi:hypothetical protein [Herbiconiux sp. L3-i23]|uniref:hypothetical protein n=1 Tax=Herbiconiux sp. L3-i23 TaxID=2905871 RepID=UPI0020641401|nr:hypothetical protein [Herbiconiux sp. L3-i23]BDI24140.1 hypothetical protein L3i23_29160 [Herbiconiux sp. L3-i23]